MLTFERPKNYHRYVKIYSMLGDFIHKALDQSQKIQAIPTHKHGKMVQNYNVYLDGHGFLFLHDAICLRQRKEYLNDLRIITPSFGYEMPKSFIASPTC